MLILHIYFGELSVNSRHLVFSQYSLGNSSNLTDAHDSSYSAVVAVPLRYVRRVTETGAVCQLAFLSEAIGVRHDSC